MIFPPPSSPFVPASPGHPFPRSSDGLQHLPPERTGEGTYPPQLPSTIPRKYHCFAPNPPAHKLSELLASSARGTVLGAACYVLWRAARGQRAGLKDPGDDSTPYAQPPCLLPAITLAVLTNSVLGWLFLHQVRYIMENEHCSLQPTWIINHPNLSQASSVLQMKALIQMLVYFFF